MTAAPFIQQLQRRTAHPLFPGVAVAAIGIAILGGAYFFEYVLGLKPCPLCLEQRVPWYILIVLGGAVAGAQTMALPRPALLGLYALTLAIALWSAYLGFFHAGVEYKWWPGPPDCTSTGLPTGLGGSDPLSSSEIVFCDQVPWALFGVSLAGFNFLFSLAVAAVAAWGGWKEVRS